MNAPPPKSATPSFTPLDGRKFQDPARTLDGQARAQVALKRLEILWFNTGTLCNITCAHCYIESSPTNDRFVYLTLADMRQFLAEIAHENYPVHTLGFTGGEPFMNPHFVPMLEEGLEAGFACLALTNAMRPMQRPPVLAALKRLSARYGEKLSLRVSLDHYSQSRHEEERGRGSWVSALAGCDWLAQNELPFTIAGRQRWGETEAAARAGFAQLFRQRGWKLTASPQDLILFPEMETQSDVPEISTGCWKKLGVAPDSPMCASQRMVVRRKGESSPSVLACTLLPYDARFALGASLKQAHKKVSLNHPHCARFCVLGGASCSD